MNLADLKKEIPYKWRVQSYSKFKAEATCVAYIDARNVMDILDDIVGPENWQDDYKVIDGNLLAGIGILTEKGWIWKWDTGTESNIEKEKGQMSDAFKRAGVKWGIGRFLYSLKIQRVPASEKKTNKNYPHPAENGKRIWDLTEYINNSGKRAPQKTPSKATASLAEEKISIDQAIFIKDLCDKIKLSPAQLQEMLHWDKLTQPAEKIEELCECDFDLVANFLAQKSMQD